MSYITDLRAELDSDAGRYAALSNRGVVDSINTVNVPKNKTNVTGSEIWEATNAAEFNALSDVLKSQWLALCGLDRINPFGVAQPVVQSIFSGAESPTVAALLILRTYNVSRAEELGFRIVKEGHVEMARAV